MTVFTIVLVHEVRGKGRRCAVENMEVAEKHQHEGPDGTELRVAMLDDTMFVHPPVLVVLGIVGERSKDLHVRPR